MLVGPFIYSNIIEPIFNDYTEMRKCTLRDKIEALAKRLKFPSDKIYIMNASKRTTKCKAYIFGIGKYQKIVLTDTLLKLTHDEILGILCNFSINFRSRIWPLEIYARNEKITNESRSWTFAFYCIQIL